MTRVTGIWAVLVAACLPADGLEEPPGVLERFLAKTEAELQRLPDHVCTQQIERFTRGLNGGPWKQEDVLRYTVGIASGQEVYARPEGRAPIDPARSGVFSTGQFGLMARHVFAWKAAKIGYRGESERAGRKAYEYEYDVPKEKSTYSLRAGNVGAVVAFQGSFHMDAETLDLLELEVQAYDIPEKVGLASADTKVTYTRVDVRGLDALLPATATLTVSTTDGLERLNRARFGQCKRFETESAMVIEEKAPTLAAAAAAHRWRLAPGTMLQIQLDTSLTPKQMKEGDAVRARLSKPVEDAEGRMVPAGAVVHGVVARLREEAMPFPIYEIGLEFNEVEAEGQTLPLRATMMDVEAETGIIRQARRMEPTFSKKQGPRLNMLVREVQNGQGILLWDAKHTTVPKGLKMKWRVAEDEFVRSEGRK